MEAAEGSLPLRALYRTVATAILETPLTCPLSRNAHSASIFSQSLLRLGWWKQNEHRLRVLADIPQRIATDRQFVLWKHPSGYSTLGLSMSELSFYSRISTGIPIVSLLAASSSEPREPGNPSILLLVVWIPEFQHVGEIGCGPFGIHASWGKQLPTAGLLTSRRFSDMH